jgi:hypothetical protein
MAPESRFHTIVKSKIMDMIDQRLTELGNGAATDFASYQFLVGHLTGLKDALSLCEQTEREFDV